MTIEDYIKADRISRDKYNLNYVYKDYSRIEIVRGLRRIAHSTNVEDFFLEDEYALAQSYEDKIDNLIKAAFERKLKDLDKQFEEI